MTFLDETVPLASVKTPLTDVRLDLDNDNNRWWSALLKIDFGSKRRSIDDFVAALPPKVSKDLVVPVVYTLEDRAEPQSQIYLSIFALRSTLKYLNDAHSFPEILAVELGTHVLERHLDFSASPRSAPKHKHRVPDSTVLMVVIDDGIALAHNFFRSAPTASRIRYAHLMAVDPDQAAGNATYGRQLDRDKIDALLQATTIDGLLDETAFYQATGQLNHASQGFEPIALARSHGTHVTALAAGFPMEEAVSDRPILCAALPPAVTADVTGQSLLPSLVMALHGLLNQTRQFALKSTLAAPPVIVNFSYGNTSGPHDGTDLVSEVLQYYSARHSGQKLWMTLPAGNNNLTQGHGVLPLESGQENALSMVSLPDDRTASHVEFWMPFGMSNSDQAKVSFTLTSPCGKANGPFHCQPDTRHRIHDANGAVVGHLAIAHKPAPTERTAAILTLLPTFSLSKPEHTAPSGRWTLCAFVAQPSNFGKSTCQVWIQRDRGLPGYRPGGRQSYFVDPKYQRFGKFSRPVVKDPEHDPSLIRRSQTLSGFAGGTMPVVVAAYNKGTGEISDYSAAGPTTENPNCSHGLPRIGPDVSSKADDSLVRPGVLSAGTRSGSVARMNGTSVAAPRLARFAAEHIADTSEGARDFLYRYLGQTPPTNPRSGAGQIDVKVPWRET